MAASIDLNPMRAGMVEDPADYRWSGYAEAMAGKARARRGLVRIIGQMAWPRAIAAGAQPWGQEAFRSIAKGRSQLEGKRGSRSLGRPALRGLYSLRDPQP